MVEIGIGLWVLCGLLAYGQFFYNLAISVESQKEISKKINSYHGDTWIGTIIRIIFLLLLLISFLIGGIPWFILTQLQSKRNFVRRMAVETANQKMYGRDWCS